MYATILVPFFFGEKTILVSEINKFCARPARGVGNISSSLSNVLTNVNGSKRKSTIDYS